MSEPTWSKGKCWNDRCVDPEFFFTQGNSSKVREYCAGCPIREDCLAYGNKHDLYGYWGGFSRRVRRLQERKHRTLLAKLQKQMKEQLQDGSEDPIAS